MQSKNVSQSRRPQAGEENFELEFVLLDHHDQDSTVFRRAGVWITAVRGFWRDGLGLSEFWTVWIWITWITGPLDLDFPDYSTLGFGLPRLSDPWIGIANPCPGIRAVACATVSTVERSRA